MFVKICLIGDGFVGKTTLKYQYMGRGFASDYLPTLGADFASMEVEIPFKNVEKTIRFQIWDLAGQPTFSQIRALYYKGTIGALLVFDVTKRPTFKNVDQWMNELIRHSGSSSLLINIVGNKIDLRREDDITADEAKSYIASYILPKYQDNVKRIKYYETSALTGENVNDAFISIGRDVLDDNFKI
ncbi:MAG: Rab family GTPase [Candidatus Hodarchaeales archaeon]|jgi:small GTP-binding protein